MALMPALAQTSSLSPPGAPDTPMPATIEPPASILMPPPTATTRDGSTSVSIALVAVSLLPVFFGAGPVVMVGAVLGGAYFLRKTHALARTPSRTTAMASFFASMVQLSALLAAVAIDAALR